MKLFIVLAALVGYLGIALAGCSSVSLSPNAASLTAPDGRVPQKEYVLSKNSKKKEGAPVPFSHETHSTKNYSVDGTRPITCVECHHTDQPKSALKAPYVTADPADRTTTLTADLLAKDPKAPDVKECKACHSQEGTKPSAWAEIPKLLYEGDTDPVVLNNEEAYHRNCNTCHDAALEARPNIKAPAGTKCAECHTGVK